MTAHKLAKLLLEGPDHEVLLSVDDQDCLLSPAKTPDVGIAHAWEEDWDFWVFSYGDPDGRVPVVVIGPEKYA